MLFCDLAGFTAHTERTDPEDVRERLTMFHTAVRQDVERFGGRIEKLMGDGVFAVFGAPTSHEDDPERAVQAGLRIMQSIAELNESHGLGLAARLAVTTGEAIVQTADAQDREGIVGDVVNTASRLEAIAAIGTVVVDERTYRAARQAIEFSALDPVTVKGKSGQVSIWRAVEPKSRFGTAVDEAPDTPFVGRASELSLLTDAFDRMLHRSSPQLVTVVGEPGVGKSRLLREFRSIVDDREELVFWRQGRCLAYGEGVSFWPIAEIVKAHAGILESEPTPTALVKLTDAVAAIVGTPEQAQWITSRLQPLVSGSGVESAHVDRAELFAAWTQFFEALAARNPLVLVVEDLHWAEDAVVEFLDHLTEWATESPILVMTAARPELLTERPEWGAAKRDSVTVSLAPLSDEDSAELIAALAGRPLMTASLQQKLLAQSGGNPLYVTEYVRLAVEEGWFDQADRGEDLPLPDSVQSIINARIDLLDPSDRTLLQIAAVIGRVFWAAAVSFADGTTPDAVRDGLRRLIRREMIRPVRRPSMEGHDEYTFSHVLIQEVAYGRLTRSERSRLHSATARWLEAVSADRINDVAALIALHLATAYEMSGDDDPEERKRIHRFSMIAVERSSGLDAAVALTHARRAEAFASDDGERARALSEVGQLIHDSIDDAAAAFDEAIEASRRAGDAETEAQAIMRLGRLRWYEGGDADAVDELNRQLLDVVDSLPVCPIKAEALVAVASTLFLRGREEEGLELARQAMTLAQQVGDTRIYAETLVVHGSSLTQMGRIEGLSDVEQALEIQLDRNDAPEAIRTYNNLATYHNDMGDSRQARDLILQAIELGTQRGLLRHVDWSHVTLAECLFALGEVDELEELVDRHIGVERLAGTQVEVAMIANRCAVRFLRGDATGARALHRTIIDRARATKDPQGLVPTLAHGLSIAAEAGELDTARALATELAGLVDQHPVFISLHLPWAVHSLVELGMLEELETLTRRAARSYEWPTLRLHLAEAALAEAAGRHQEALDLLDPLIDEADRRGLRPTSVVARIDAARTAGALGDTELAEALAARAVEDATRMGATLYAKRAAALLGGEADTATGS